MCLLSSDGSTVVEQFMRVVDTETPIYEILPLNNNNLENLNNNSDNLPSCNNDDDNLRNRNNNNDDNDNPEENSDLDEEQYNFLDEFECKAKRRDVQHEAMFRSNVLNKLKRYIKSRTFKSNAAKLRVL